MNLLDRHIFRSAFFVCAATIGLFAFLLMLGNLVRDLIGPLMAGQLSYLEVFHLVLLYPPFVISYALPMGMLTGVLLTLGRLSADNEIVAMRAAGISLTRLALPIFVLGAIGAGVGLFVNFESMPWARLQYEKELTADLRTNPLNFIVPRTFVRYFPNAIIYVDEKDGPVLKGCWVWKLDAGRRVTQLVRAAQGRFVYDKSTNELILSLSQAQVETRNENNPESFAASEPVMTFEHWDEERYPLDRILNSGGVRQKLRWMTYGELHLKLASLARQKVAPADRPAHAKQEMDVAYIIQEKFTMAVAVLSFALIGVPLGVKISRRETSANLGIALALVLAYYFLTVAIGWLDQLPAYRPDLILWLPNLALLAVAVTLFEKIEPRRGR